MLWGKQAASDGGCEAAVTSDAVIELHRPARLNSGR